MCIDAPESTANSLSSGFVEDGAGDDQTSEGELDVALSFSLSLWILLAISLATLRARCSCFKVSSSDLSSNYGAWGLRSSGSGWTLSYPNFYVLHAALRPQEFCALRKIDLDFGGSAS